MTALAGTITYYTAATVVAASSGDGDTIAAAFNGIVIPGVDIVGAPTATNSSGTVTILWPAANVRCGNELVLNAVTNLIAPMSALTSPITSIKVGTQAGIV